MDANSAFINGGATAAVMVAVGLIVRFWNEIKNHMIVSRCCGKKMEMGVGVVDMPADSPDNKKLEIKIPGGNGDGV
jgi:hypothetical protein